MSQKTSTLSKFQDLYKVLFYIWNINDNIYEYYMNILVYEYNSMQRHTEVQIYDTIRIPRNYEEANLQYRLCIKFRY